AGGLSSWAIANSSVDLPQPDSPTMPMNSPLPRSKLTWSTALTLPCLVAYSTLMSLTRRMGSPVLAWCRPRSSAGALDTDPPYWPERRVADLVERVVKQSECGAEDRDPQARHESPQVLADGQGFVVLSPVQHRSPAHRVRVAEADELQASGEQHVVDRRTEEGRDDQRSHVRDDLDGDDVGPALAANPGALQVIPPAHPKGLAAQLPGAVGVSGDDQDRDQPHRSAVRQVGGDDQQQREAREDQQRVGNEVERVVGHPAEIGGRDPHGHRKRRRQHAADYRDDQGFASSPDELRENVLAIDPPSEQAHRR